MTSFFLSGVLVLDPSVMHILTLFVEPGIGYSGGHWANYKIFESYALHAYGGMNRVGHCNPDWYETVIPNYFDISEFEFTPEDKEDYFYLWVGYMKVRVFILFKILQGKLVFT